MDKNLFQQAKDAITNLTSMQESPNEGDQQAAKDAIQAAYTNASPEEQQKLQELEQHLEQKNHINPS